MREEVLDAQLERIRRMSETAEPIGSGELEEALAQGYMSALKLDSERLALERRIVKLAASAEEPDSAQELRRAWLRYRTLNQERADLKEMLARLRARRGQDPEQ